MKRKADGSEQREVGVAGAAGAVRWSGRLNEKGAYTLNLRSSRRAGHPKRGDANYHLAWCLYPYQTIQLKRALENGTPREELESVSTLTSDAPSKATPGARELVYAVKTHRGTAELRYVVDFSDGVRCFELTSVLSGKLNAKLTFSKFRKVDGYWVAMDVQQTRYSTAVAEGRKPQGTRGRQVVIKEIRLNKDCSPDSTQLPVAVGDTVILPGKQRFDVKDMAKFRLRLRASLVEPGATATTGSAPKPGGRDKATGGHSRPEA